MPARPRSAWRVALAAAGAALRAAQGSRHVAQLCAGHQCTSLEAPLMDYDPVAEKCNCIANPCWDDNGRQHSCQDVRHPFLVFSYDQSGGLQCRCSSISQQNSVYLSKHVCAGHKCDHSSFPMLDLDDGGECKCLAHPCWNDNGLNHSCAGKPDFPILNYRLNPDGSNVCECMAMWHPQTQGGTNVLEAAAKEEEQRLEAENSMEHGFPMPPDTRPRGCNKNITEDLSGLSVSVIIPWLAEKWYHMEATLKSLLYFTPDYLVKEFIFISDGNADSREDKLMAISDKVRVLALRERVGLMVAKTKGVEMATAPVLIFLEAHCIVNHGWLEPLLQRLKEDPKILAMPQLDIIPEDNFYQYHKNVAGYWRYEWNFNLIYSNPGAGLIKDQSEPYLSPGTSGGVFAMRRDWFNHLGFFDEGMEQWGGDHIELTMKVWRCGGRIEVVPCSRIGHLFRTPAKRPYDVEVEQVVKNYARLARVWAGSYLDTFYKMKPEARAFKIPDLEELQRKHDELGCHSMEWYVQNVDIEMGWEADKVCIPGGDVRHGGCSGPALQARSTIDKTMPREEYLEGRAQADVSLEASRSGQRRIGKAWEYEARLEL